jgi:non-homologous end joining protein Ku
VRRRLGRVEQRVAGPHVCDVIGAEVGVLEQVRGLAVDLERVVVIEQIEVEQLGHHTK